MHSSAPPCFRTSVPCTLERSDAAVFGELRLSKSQKRHLREQRSAVRRAAFATHELKQHLLAPDKGYAGISEAKDSSQGLHVLSVRLFDKV